MYVLKERICMYIIHHDLIDKIQQILYKCNNNFSTIQRALELLVFLEPGNLDRRIELVEIYSSSGKDIRDLCENIPNPEHVTGVDMVLSSL